MTMEGAEPNPVAADYILDWLGDSVVTFFPSLINDPYNPTEIEGYPWWDDHHLSPHQIANRDLITATTQDINPIAIPANANTLTKSFPEELVSSKKRKSASNLDYLVVKSSSSSSPPSQPQRKITSTGGCQKKVGGKKRSAASLGNNCGTGNGKEGRWAEQLLNPCAAAITANNLTRVQHLLYVLHELASLSAEPNHRLAAYGLRALTNRLSPSSASSISLSSSAMTFSTAEPRFFQKSLLKFNEISPWFAFPSNITNSSILQLLNDGTGSANQGSNKHHHRSALHILDIGVSHGAQWPTLLDALSRQHGGPPPVVRLTVVSPSTNNTPAADAAPFAAGPPGYNSSPLLLEFAKSLNINLQIHRIDEGQLIEKALNLKLDEILVVCAQFRLNHFNHSGPNSERSKFLSFLRGLNPRGVILTENNINCSCTSCADFATGFARRVELLWSFLESTSVAFKGRESEERRMMEGEAAKGLIGKSVMNEGKERWCEKMKAAGFVEEVVGEDVLDSGKALLRKHDGNWEMRVEEEESGLRNVVSLGWKGQPVSFCSLWKLGKY